jgi:DNA-binding NtrC family response regulator
MFGKPHQRTDFPSQASSSRSSLPRGVLVVDDDSTLLQLLQTVLQSEGFTPFLARGGAEAVALYEQHRDEIGMVLLDVRMPGMDGPQTLVELRRINPDVACCFMSGFSGGYSENELRQLGGLHMFEKPFHLGEFGRVLRQLGVGQGQQTA